ncbi:MAG: hypothetical protein U5N58_14225 [Actinomycetota bacterium]|nr:hypothetical protein [Actinomycetota bacterium]
MMAIREKQDYQYGGCNLLPCLCFLLNSSHSAAKIKATIAMAMPKGINISPRATCPIF